MIIKILFLTWKSFGNEDMIVAFRNKGHEVVEMPFDDKDLSTDKNAVDDFIGKAKQSGADCVFSFNYFPRAALACKEMDMPYISWIYDSPYVRLYNYTTVFPTNHIFVFDSSVYEEFHSSGINTVHFLPMAANTDRLSKMSDWATFAKTGWDNKHDVAFIGSLYTEKHQFYQRMTNITDYTRGYLEGLMAAQKQVFGYNFIQESLVNNPDIVKDMRNSLPMTPNPDGVETVEYLFAQYVINREITAQERKEYLTDIADKYGLDLYTPDKSLTINGCTNHGPVDYYDFAPYVFKKAKINLNISLRSIITGMPLRAFDIMGAGGFLLTNYQSDFLNFFVPGEDFVYYESKQDMMDKIGYYLAHEDERAAIAENGFNKIKSQHTYECRVDEMLSYI